MNDSTKPFMKVNIDFTYPDQGLKPDIQQKINRIFGGFINEKFISDSSSVERTANRNVSITDELNKYIADVDTDVQDLSRIFRQNKRLEMIRGCYQNLNVSIQDSCRNEIMVAKTETSSYMGGAHGSYGLYYTNIDLKTGNAIKEKDVFENYSEQSISRLLQQYIKTNNKDAISMIFVMNDIKPNSNFYFNKDGMVYTFNQYEIAAYAAGVIKVTIPYSEIKDNLKERFRWDK